MALNLSFTTKVEKYICWSRHWYCTMDDKPNTLLAGQLVPKPFDSALPKLWLQNGQLTQNPQLILREFFNFYSKPYASPEIFSAARAKKWFYDLHLSSSACRTNGWRFYGGWGHDSYQKPKPNKSNFPDITIVNMQKFCPPPLYSPLLMICKKVILYPHVKIMPLSMSKLGKDHGDYTNCRPISLINVDLKIMTKI